MKKRILSSILAATVAVSGLCLASVAVSAADASADAEYALSISLDKEELKAGDKVVATISLDKNAGLIGLNFDLNYDESIIKVDSEKVEKELPNGGTRVTYNHPIVVSEDVFSSAAFTGVSSAEEVANPVCMRWSLGTLEENIEDTGVLVSITFVVNSDVKPGAYKDIISVSLPYEDSITYLNGDYDDQGYPVSAVKDGSTTSITAVPSVKVPCTEHVWSDWTEDTATCTEGGKQTRTCSVCGEVEEKTTEALGHDFGEWTETKAATCTEDGSRERVCARCGEKETETVKALGHDVTEWTVDKAATCTEDGSQSGVCSRCNETVTEVIPATGHQWGEWTVVKPATETEVGSEERVCSVCNEKETREIPVLAPAVSETEPSGTNAPQPGTDEGDKNSPTGVLPVATAVVVMAAASGVIAVISKKRK